MGVVHKAVEDGVGVSRVADERVPFVHGDLAGEDRRAAAVTFLEDFVEVTTGSGIERFEAPIIEDEELDASETQSRLERSRRANVIFKNGGTCSMFTRLIAIEC
jgi:hypothetical protein